MAKQEQQEADQRLMENADEAEKYLQMGTKGVIKIEQLDYECGYMDTCIYQKFNELYILSWPV